MEWISHGNSIVRQVDDWMDTREGRAAQAKLQLLSPSQTTGTRALPATSDATPSEHPSRPPPLAAASAVHALSSSRADLQRSKAAFARAVNDFERSSSFRIQCLLTIALTNKQLRFAEFTRFPQLTTLDLSQNAFSDDALLDLRPLRGLHKLTLQDNLLSSLAQTGIDTLPLLHTLDLRDNNFPSLDALLTELRGCNALLDLHIRLATVDKAVTATPSSFAESVFTDLRGLQSCDDVNNSKCVRNDPLSVKAVDVLWKLGRVGPNNLKRVNLTNKQLPQTFLHSVLSALIYLDVCELDARGNEWCTEPSYQDTVLLLMGPRFCWLDGESITDARRMLAVQADKQKGVSQTGRSPRCARMAQRPERSLCMGVHLFFSLFCVCILRNLVSSSATYWGGRIAATRLSVARRSGWTISLTLGTPWPPNHQ
jgi:hypothetical protein